MLLHVPVPLHEPRGVTGWSLVGCAGLATPRPAFGTIGERITRNDHVLSLDLASIQSLQGRSPFDDALQELWLHKESLLRYSVSASGDDAVDVRQLGGAAQLALMFNRGRGVNKRAGLATGAPVHVQRARKSGEFTFVKANGAEILFRITQRREGAAQSANGAFDVCPLKNESDHLVVLNVSPVDFGHVLILPDVTADRLQILSAADVLLGVRFLLQSGSPRLRLGFQSLGAFASVNHLHLQALYVRDLGVATAGAVFPVEAAPVVYEGAADGVDIGRVVDFPSRAVVLRVCANAVCDRAVESLAALTAALCARLVAADVPHSMMCARSAGDGVRVFVYPQQRITRSDPLDIGPAFPEMSGMLIAMRATDMQSMTPADAAAVLTRSTVPSAQFDDIFHGFLGLVSAETHVPR